MKRLIWIVRCARQIRRCTHLKWSEAWEVASNLLNSLDNDLSEDPKSVAYDELSYWYNDE